MPRPLLAVDGPFCPWIHIADVQDRWRRWSIPQRRLTNWLLVTVIDGEEQLVIDGWTQRIAAGSTYLVQPGVLADISSERGDRLAFMHLDLVWNPQRQRQPVPGGNNPDPPADRGLLQPGARAVFGVDLPSVVPPQLAPAFAASIPQLAMQWLHGSPLVRVAAAQQAAALILDWAAQTAAGADTAADDVEQRVARAESRTARRVFLSVVDEKGQQTGTAVRHRRQLIQRHLACADIRSAPIISDHPARDPGRRGARPV